MTSIVSQDIICLHGWHDTVCPHSHQSGTWIFKILNQSLATSETLIPFTGLRSSHGIIMKGFVSFLLCLRSFFLNCKWKFDANSLFHKVCHFPGPQQFLTALNTKTLNVKCTKTQLSVTMALTTLIHIKSTRRHQSRNFWLAYHTCHSY